MYQMSYNKFTEPFQPPPPPYPLLATIWSKLGQILSNNPVAPSDPQPSSMTLIEVTSKIKQLSTLQWKKTPTGLKNIPCRLFKVAAHTLAPSPTYLYLYMYLFNLDFVWSISICLENKIFEKQIHNKLYQYLMTNDLFCPCQRGFRAKRSTQTALIKVINEWLSNMDKVYYQQSGFGIHNYNTRRTQDFNLPKLGKTSLKEFLNTQSSNVGTQCSTKYAKKPMKERGASSYTAFDHSLRRKQKNA